MVKPIRSMVQSRYDATGGNRRTWDETSAYFRLVQRQGELKQGPAMLACFMIMWFMYIYVYFMYIIYIYVSYNDSYT